MIECRPALQIIADWAKPEALIYCDPPYVWTTRDRRGAKHNGLYRHEMTEDDHLELLTALRSHPGAAMISGYRCDLYEASLDGWTRYDLTTTAYRNSERVESLWLNPVAAATERQRPLIESHP